MAKNQIQPFGSVFQLKWIIQLIVFIIVLPLSCLGFLLGLIVHPLLHGMMDWAPKFILWVQSEESDD